MYWKIASLLIFAIFCLWVWYESKKSVKNMQNDENAFWERERQANNVRRKSLDGLEYITIPSDLPFDVCTENDNIRGYISIIRELMDEKIVNFTGYSNTELKLKYGTANITALSSYDQNYTSLVTTLQKWADELLKLSKEEEAYRIMEFSVSTKCDIKRTFVLVGKKYLENGETDKYEELISVAKELRSLNRSAIVLGLEEINSNQED